MSYHTTDIPKFTDESAYHRVLKSVADKISSLEGVVAVYQIGGISTPGISDLDMVVVFENDHECSFNVHESLSAEEKYLFIHKLYGTSLKHFHESAAFSFFQNYSLLNGEEIIRETLPDQSAINVIQTQIALEYMLKMYVNATLQETYKIIQVRSLLLHGKALNYDVSYFGDSAGELDPLVKELLDIRKNWFESAKSQPRLLNWFHDFYKIYPGVLNGLIQKKGFFLSNKSSSKIARNISLVKGNELFCKHEGKRLPAFPVNILGKKYFRLMNRLNKFELQVPYKDAGIPSVLGDYFDFQIRQRTYNRKYLPHFYPLSSSLLA